MEKSGGEGTGKPIPSPIQEQENPDFDLLHTFLNNETNFDHMIGLIDDDHCNLIPYQDPVCHNYDQPLGFEAATNHAPVNGIPVVDAPTKEIDDDDDDEDDDEEEEDERSSAEETISTTKKKKQKMESGNNKGKDRSKMLMSERKRRGSMKKKLYTLRSLVPNITKMDKASIIGDAVLYVQHLQMRIKKLRSEISAIDSSNSLLSKPTQFLPVDPSKTTRSNPEDIDEMIKKYCPNPSVKNITQMDVYEVEKGGYYVRIVSNRTGGIVVLLCRALESLTEFDVQTTTLAAADDDTYLLTFNFQVTEGGDDMDMEKVKKRIEKAFVDQGFEFGISPSV